MQAVTRTRDGVVRRMLTEGYPEFDWVIETKPLLRAGVLSSSIQIHNFPAHVVTRDPRTSTLFLENDYVYIWYVLYDLRVMQYAHVILKHIVCPPPKKRSTLLQVECS